MSDVILGYLLPAVFILIAGAFDGVGDRLMFHYNKQSQFWNHKLSWTNKYKNHDPAQGPAYFGSTSFLVWTTDGWHLMKFGRNLFTTIAIISFAGGDRTQYRYILDGVGYWFINRVGFSLAYK